MTRLAIQVLLIDLIYQVLLIDQGILIYQGILILLIDQGAVLQVECHRREAKPTALPVCSVSVLVFVYEVRLASYILYRTRKRLSGSRLANASHLYGSVARWAIRRSGRVRVELA